MTFEWLCRSDIWAKSIPEGLERLLPGLEVRIVNKGLIVSVSLSSLICHRMKTFGQYRFK